MSSKEVKAERLFFLLSGEHPTLSAAELKAVLEAEGFCYQELEELPQILILKVNKDCVKMIASRCSMVKAYGIELFRCRAEVAEVFERAESLKLRKFVRNGQSFEVRVKRIRASCPELSVEMLERELGRILLQRAPGARVKLVRPDKTFLGVLSGGTFVFGLKLGEVSPKPFFDRSAQRRPFFHPSTMQPKLARAIVNLARAKEGRVLLDPFCGAGGILIEGGLLKCKVIGADVKRDMIEGAMENLVYYGIPPAGVVADAKKMPFKYVDLVVTDVPYGRASTTLGLSAELIVKKFLREANAVLVSGGYLCMTCPSSIDGVEAGKEAGFEVVERHLIPVHRGLTREVLVFKKP